METEAQEAFDAVLCLTAHRLDAVVRNMDVISQCDGDCFGVLLPRTTLAEGLLVAERVQQAIDTSDPAFHHHSVQFRSKVSVVEVAEGDDPVRLLLRPWRRWPRRNSCAYCQSGQWPANAPLPCPIRWPKLPPRIARVGSTA